MQPFRVPRMPWGRTAIRYGPRSSRNALEGGELAAIIRRPRSGPAHRTRRAVSVFNVLFEHALCLGALVARYRDACGVLADAIAIISTYKKMVGVAGFEPTTPSPPD